MSSDSAESVTPLSKTSSVFPPQMVGWFILLLVVGALVTVRFFRPTADPFAGDGEFRHLVDINQAEEADLLNLPEIGPSLAKKILRRRVDVGEFRSIDDLNSVSGIGPQTLKQLAPYLLFSTSTPDGITSGGNLASGTTVGNQIEMVTQPRLASGQYDE